MYLRSKKKQHSEDPVGGLHSHDSANDGLLQISGRPAVFLIGCFFSLLITYDHVDLTRVHDNSSANISGKKKEKKRRDGYTGEGEGRWEGGGGVWQEGEERRERRELVTYSCSRETSPLNACLSIDWISFLYK